MSLEEVLVDTCDLLHRLNASSWEVERVLLAELANRMKEKLGLDIEPWPRLGQSNPHIIVPMDIIARVMEDVLKSVLDEDHLPQRLDVGLLPGDPTPFDLYGHISFLVAPFGK